MKKVWMSLGMLCALLMMSCTLAYAAEAETLVLSLEIESPVMLVNGSQMEIDPGRGTAPAIIDGRTMVPIRAIIEAMGGTAEWEASSQTAVLWYDNNVIRLTLNERTAYFNDEAYTLDASPAVINGRTMLPIRFIAERFGLAVDWKQAEQTLTITNNPAANAPLPENSDASRALVVYFSATGNTKTLAEKVADAAGASLLEIVPETAYTSADLDYHQSDSRASREIQTDARPAMEALTVDWSAYDVIFLGYPIWWGQCPPVVKTFLNSYDLSGKTIMPFCTSGSSGISGSLSGIRELCPDSTVTEGFRGTAATTVDALYKWFAANGYTVAGQ